MEANNLANSLNVSASIVLARLTATYLPKWEQVALAVRMLAVDLRGKPPRPLGPVLLIATDVRVQCFNTSSGAEIGAPWSILRGTRVSPADGLIVVDGFTFNGPRQRWALSMMQREANAQAAQELVALIRPSRVSQTEIHYIQRDC
jgi:hypothetical protein